MTATDKQTATGSPSLLLDVLDGLIDGPDPSEVQRATLRVVRDYWRAVHGQDADGLRAILADDVVTELPFSESGRVDPGSFRAFRGIDEVMAFWATAWSREGDGLGVFNPEVTVSGDGRVVFIEGFGQVTMRQTGRDYRNRYVLRIVLRDGKVASFREYYNPIIAARAFGRAIAGE